MPAKDPILYVLHIKDSCERILLYTSGSKVQEPYDSIVIDAVCRNLQIIGEAARKLDEPFRRSHPEVPWREAIGLRNVIVHAYDGVVPDVIREIVENDIPPLLASVRRILDEAQI
jgi:uncharacterized protein with HEPN domain